MERREWKKRSDRSQRQFFFFFFNALVSSLSLSLSLSLAKRRRQLFPSLFTRKPGNFNKKKKRRRKTKKKIKKRKVEGGGKASAACLPEGEREGEGEGAGKMSLEEADGALFAALKQQGLQSVEDVTSIGGLEASTLYAICAESMRTINPNSSIPLSLTPNPSDRFRTCTDLAKDIKQLGYKFDVGFQQILYPTVKDTRQLLVFLIDKFPRQNLAGGDSALGNDASALGLEGPQGLRVKVKIALKAALVAKKEDEDKSERATNFKSSSWYEWQKGPNDLQLLNELGRQETVAYLLERSAYERLCANKASFDVSDLALRLDKEALDRIEKRFCEAGDDERTATSAAEELDSKAAVTFSMSKSTASLVEFGVYGSRTLEGAERGGSTSAETQKGDSNSSGEKDSNQNSSENAPEVKESIVDVRKREIGELHRQLVGLSQTCQDTKDNILSKLEAIKKAEKAIGALHSQVQQLRGDHSVWKEASSLASKGGDDLESTLDALKGEIDAFEAEFGNEKAQWLELKKPVLEEIEQMRSVDSQRKERRQKVERDTLEMKQKISRLQIDLRHRNQEKLQLQGQYKNADKSLNRYNYVRRIGEIIKNVKKQEVEIERILADTLQVQREINTAEESLHRAYTLADEVIFREARSSKSVASKDLYQLLSEVHSNFTQVVERIRAVGKMERETQECTRKTEELLRTPFAELIHKARKDLGELNKCISELTVG